MTTPQLSTFAARLHHARERKGLSQKDLAIMVDVARRSVIHWEQGRLPHPQQRRKLAKALGVTVPWLMFGEE